MQKPIRSAATAGASIGRFWTFALISVHMARRNRLIQSTTGHCDMGKHFGAIATREADLRRALDDGEIEPHFQPVFRLDDGRIAGFEALARWHHRVRGVIGPDSFLALAERMEIVDLVTYTVLRQSCAAAQDWPRDAKLIVNVSPRQIADPWLASRLLAIMVQSEFAANRLVLDVTADAITSDWWQAEQFFATLQDAGIRIALDLTALRGEMEALHAVRVDHVKIDVASVGVETVRKIADRARMLGVTITAKGVETSRSLDMLRACGCVQAQGNLLGMPLPARETAAMLTARRHRPVMRSV